MSAITIMLIILVALLAGMEGILDEFQFHQPLVACTLIGLVSGHLSEGIILGGSLQMIALGWANVGAAVAPDAALASVASAIIMVLGLNGGTVNTQTAISTSIAVAVPLSVAGLFLTMICRTIAIPLVHLMDGAAEKGDYRKIEIYQILGILLQGVRIAVPAAALCIVPAEAVTNVLNQMPAWLSGGMTVGGGMVAAVGYQHDGNSRSMAILCYRFRISCIKRININRFRCFRCCYCFNLLRIKRKRWFW